MEKFQKGCVFKGWKIWKYIPYVLAKPIDGWVLEVRESVAIKVFKDAVNLKIKSLNQKILHTI